MRSVKGFIIVFTLVSLVALGVLGFVAAQDATATSSTTSSTTSSSGTSSTGMVQCDSNLIAGLVTAEHFFDFDKVHQQLMSSGTSATTPVDLNNIDKGQFAPLAGTMTSLVPAFSDEQISSITSMLSMDDASLQAALSGSAAGTSAGTTTTLMAPSVSGEDPQCTQLRDELTKFFTVISFQDSTGALSGTGTSGVSGTPAAGATSASGTTGTGGISPTSTP